MSDTTVKQVGGDHYSKQGAVCPHCHGKIQHWDYAAGLPYLEGQVSKYLDRHQSKGGFQDLLKSLTYWEKLARTDYPAEYAEWLAQRGLTSVMPDPKPDAPTYVRVPDTMPVDLAAGRVIFNDAVEVEELSAADAVHHWKLGYSDTCDTCHKSYDDGNHYK